MNIKLIILLAFFFYVSCKSEIVCPNNEEFSETGANICEGRCSSKRESLFCKAAPKSGCVCINGFLRNSDGFCIPSEECDKSCGGDINAILSECYDLCPITCGNKDFPPLCPAVCRPQEPRCRCKTGYILDFNATSCVLPEQCDCEENEIYATIGKCDRLCDETEDTCDPEINVEPGCFCKKGFYRKDGDCVPLDECVQCKINEEARDCALKCLDEQSCKSIKDGPQFCPIPEIYKCKVSCLCKEGFARNSKGQCIPQAKCCTDPNSEFVLSPNPCPGGTCQQIEFSKCALPTPNKGCQCKKGFVKKSSKDKTCVPIKSCKKKC